MQGSLQNHHRISRFMFRAGEKRVKRETGESPVLSRNCEMVVFSIMPLAEILPGRGKNRPDLSACESIWNFKPDIAEGSSELNPSLLSGLKENAEQVWKP